MSKPTSKYKDCKWDLPLEKVPVQTQFDTLENNEHFEFSQCKNDPFKREEKRK